METIKEQWLIFVSTPIYLCFIGIEILISHWRKQQKYALKDTFINVYLMVLNSILDLSFRSLHVALFFYCYQFAIVQWNNKLFYWVILFVVEDFLYYWLHRFDHEIRLFWAVHVTHHSSKFFNFTVGFRSSVFQPLYRFIYFLPMPFLGFQPFDILFAYAATQIWGIFVHTELIQKMGWLEYVFVTPSHHRVHHASNAKYLDKNMGMFLIIWDKIFGTFQAELPSSTYQNIQYGLTNNVTNQHPLHIVFHEWKQILADIHQPNLTFAQKFKYIFGKPGYSHDNSRKTSKQLQELEVENEF